MTDANVPAKSARTAPTDLWLPSFKLAMRCIFYVFLWVGEVFAFLLALRVNRWSGLWGMWTAINGWMLVTHPPGTKSATPGDKP